MRLAALLLILVAAVAHAAWNLSAKRVGAGGAAFVWLYSTVSCVVYLPLAAVAVVTTSLELSWLVAVAVSAVLHLAYFLLLQRGYATGDLSVVYPLARGTGPMLSVLAAVLVLGERPGVLGLAGAAAVVAGVFVISGGVGRSSVTSGVGFGLLTGVVIAVYTLWDAHAVTALAVPPLILNWGTSFGETLLLTPYALANRTRVAHLWRAHRWNVVAVAVLSPLAYVLVLFALRIAPVSLVAPARELSIVIGGAAAWKLLGEPQPLRRLTGALIVLAGVVVLAASW